MKKKDILLHWSQSEKTESDGARSALNELTNGAESLLGKNIIVRIQSSPVYGTFSVAVELVKVAVFMGFDEADVVEIDLVLGVGGDFRVPLQGDCLVS